MTYYVKNDNPTTKISDLKIDSSYNLTSDISGNKKNNSGNKKKDSGKPENLMLHTTFIDVRDLPLLPMSNYFQSKVKIMKFIVRELILKKY